MNALHLAYNRTCEVLLLQVSGDKEQVDIAEKACTDAGGKTGTYKGVLTLQFNPQNIDEIDIKLRPGKVGLKFKAGGCTFDYTDRDGFVPGLGCLVEDWNRRGRAPGGPTCTPPC